MKPVTIINRLLFVGAEDYLENFEDVDNLHEFKTVMLKPALESMNIEVEDNNIFGYWPNFNMSYDDYIQKHTNRWFGNRSIDLVVLIAGYVNSSGFCVDSNTLKILNAANAAKTPIMVVPELEFENVELSTVYFMNNSEYTISLDAAEYDNNVVNVPMLAKHITKGCEFQTSGQYNLNCAYIHRMQVCPPLSRRVRAHVKHTKIDDLRVKPTTKIVYDTQDDEIILMLGFNV